MRTTAWAWASILACWGVAFVLACRLADSDLQPPVDSVLGRLLGASRTAIGQSLYLQADIYFHQGASPQKKEAFSGVFSRWWRELSPQAHVHSESTGVYELMPWFRFATQMDPHNVEAYLTAAYWLAGEGGRPDLAETILVEAQQNNPLDYRILQEKGRLLMKDHRDIAASKALDFGLKLWPGQMDPQDEQVRLDLGQMLTLRAFLYELEGRREQSLHLMKWASSLFPNNAALAARVAAMDRGELDSVWARETWDQLFSRKMVCAREDHDYAHEHEHEHED